MQVRYTAGLKQRDGSLEEVDWRKAAHEGQNAADKPFSHAGVVGVLHSW